jgi:hypothetical protein
MTVGELIMRLQAVDPTLTVSITDGWTGAIYEGAFPIHVVTIGEDQQVLDIGIGGYHIEEER